MVPANLDFSVVTIYFSLRIFFFFLIHTMLEKEGLAIWFLNRICQLQGEDEIDTSFLPNGEANIVLFLKKSVQIFISLGLSKECG